MRNKLTDLNNHLFEQLERLNDPDLEEEELKKEINRSKAMAGIANSIINNGRLLFDAHKHANEYGLDGKEAKKLLPGGLHE